MIVMKSAGETHCRPGFSPGGRAGDDILIEQTQQQQQHTAPGRITRQPPARRPVRPVLYTRVYTLYARTHTGGAEGENRINKTTDERPGRGGEEGVWRVFTSRGPRVNRRPGLAQY